jgi:soluble lytic murein transglycosylase
MFQKTLFLLTIASVCTLGVFEVGTPNFERSLSSVDETSRMAHAKELLGSDFFGSDAHKVSSDNEMHLWILSEFERRLPGAFKAQAFELSETLIRDSHRYGLDPLLVMAVIATESSFRPRARGSVGEIGLMQLRPQTAQWVARRFNIAYGGAASLERPYVNVRLGIAYMAYLRAQFPDQAGHYVSAYNMGTRNVRRLLANQTIPQIYFGKVISKYNKLYSSMYASDSGSSRRFAVN